MLLFECLLCALSFCVDFSCSYLAVCLFEVSFLPLIFFLQSLNCNIVNNVLYNSNVLLDLKRFIIQTFLCKSVILNICIIMPDTADFIRIMQMS